MNDNFLPIKDVAAELGISMSTLRRLIKSKAIPAARVGSKLLRVSRTALDAYKASLTV